MSPKTEVVAGAAGRRWWPAASALVLGVIASSGAGAVVGGREASGPLAASAIMVLNARGGMCSGVVVAPDVVLTAAHCVAGGEIRVHYRGEDGQPVLIVPTARASHPGYEPQAVTSRKRSIDLALVRTPADLPSRFSAAPLSGASVSRGSPILVGGFGVAREGDAKSTGTFRTAALAAVEPYGPGRILLWTSDPAGAGAGACEGDSGGPMVAGNSVAAVTSWAAGAGRRGCGSMTQGVLVAPQRAWIDGTLSGWGRTAVWE